MEIAESPSVGQLIDHTPIRKTPAAKRKADQESLAKKGDNKKSKPTYTPESKQQGSSRKEHPGRTTPRTCLPPESRTSRC